MNNLFRCCALPAALACLTIGALAGPVSATATSAVGQRPSGTNATVSCTRLNLSQVRCVMTIKNGAGLNGTVTMRITRAKLVVAVGNGRFTRGKATLTMRVLHRMTPGQYTVAMVVTLHVSKVQRLG